MALTNDKRLLEELKQLMSEAYRKGDGDLMRQLDSLFASLSSSSQPPSYSPHKVWREDEIWPQLYDPELNVKPQDVTSTVKETKMNYSTAVFLIPDIKVRAIRCAYELDEKGNAISGKTYTFKTFDESIQKDDIVVVPTGTRVLFTCVKVIEEDLEFDVSTGVELKWIVAKVDEAGYKKILGQEEQLIKTLRAGEKEKKRKEIAESLGIGLEALKQQPIAVEHKKKD